MKARLTFPGSVVFEQTDGQEITVEKGTAFEVLLIDGPPADNNFLWGTTADRVLTMGESDVQANYHKVTVNADKVGTSRVMVIEPADNITFRLVIHVQASEEAGSLSIPPGSEEDLPT